MRNRKKRWKQLTAILLSIGMTVVPALSNVNIAYADIVEQVQNEDNKEKDPSSESEDENEKKEDGTEKKEDGTEKKEEGAEKKEDGTEAADEEKSEDETEENSESKSEDETEKSSESKAEDETEESSESKAEAEKETETAELDDKKIIEDEEETIWIYEFKPLATAKYEFDSKPELDTLLGHFPTSLKVVVGENETDDASDEENEKTKNIDVTWDCDEVYEDTTAETYTFYPVWDESKYEVSDSSTVTVPEITVAILNEEAEKVVLTAEVDDLEVTVTADAGVLPEGAEVKVVKLENEPEELALIETAVKENSKDTQNKKIEEAVSMDITIWYLGEEIQPKDGTVQVSFKDLTEDASSEDEKGVFHMSDDRQTATDMDAEFVDDQVIFETTHFSNYYYVKLTEQVGSDVVKIGTTQYTSIEAAVTAASEGDTIEIIGDITLTESVDLGTRNLTLLVDKGSEHTITGKESAVLCYEGKSTIEVKGKLTLDNVTIEAKNDPGYGAITIMEDNAELYLENCSATQKCEPTGIGYVQTNQIIQVAEEACNGNSSAPQSIVVDIENSTLKADYKNKQGARGICFGGASSGSQVSLKNSTLQRGDGTKMVTYTRGISTFMADKEGELSIDIENSHIIGYAYPLLAGGTIANKGSVNYTAQNTEFIGWCCAEIFGKENQLSYENCEITGINEFADNTSNDYTLFQSGYFKDEGVPQGGNNTITVKDCTLKAASLSDVTSNQTIVTLFEDNSTVNFRGKTTIYAEDRRTSMFYTPKAENITFDKDVVIQGQGAYFDVADETEAFTPTAYVSKQDETFFFEKDVTKALKSASSGDTVHIRLTPEQNNTYADPIVIKNIKQGVTLDGEDKVTLTGGITGSGEADGLTIQGFKFKDKPIKAQWTTSSGTITIKDNEFSGVTAAGHKMGAINLTDRPANVTISGNTIIGNDTDTEYVAAYLPSVKNLVFSKNVIKNTTGTALNVGVAGANTTVEITGNTMENWACNGGEGRAMRLTGMADGSTVWTINKNQMTKAKPYRESFVKIDKVGAPEKLDLTGNYWSGENPLFAKTQSQIPLAEIYLLGVIDYSANAPIYPFYKDAAMTEEVLASQNVQQEVKPVENQAVESADTVEVPDKEAAGNKALAEVEKANQGQEISQETKDALLAKIEAVTTPESVAEKTNEIAYELVRNQAANVPANGLEEAVNLEKMAEVLDPAAKKVVVYIKPILKKVTVDVAVQGTSDLTALDAVLVPSELVFEISPYMTQYTEDNKQIGDEDVKVDNKYLAGNEITVRLPIPTEAVGKYAKIVHRSEEYGDTIYYKKVELENGERYVSMQLSHFSEFILSFVDELPKEETKTYNTGSSGGSGTTSLGNWTQDSTGWWYSYTKGGYPADTWAYLFYGGKYGWYYFNEKGYMQSGWLTDKDGQRYYLNPVSNGYLGIMMTGWIQIDGKWYYFTPLSGGPMGSLVKNTTTPDGYIVNENGERVN